MSFSENKIALSTKSFKSLKSFFTFINCRQRKEGDQCLDVVETEQQSGGLHVWCLLELLGLSLLSRYERVQAASKDQRGMTDHTAKHITY